MTKIPGYIYAIDDGRFCIAYTRDQIRERLLEEKLMVHVFVDENCTIPIPEKAARKILISSSHLTLIGFHD